MMFFQIKKILLSAGALALAVSTVSAALIVEESFDYPNGSLNAKNGGIGFTGAWVVYAEKPGTISVAGNAASMNGSAGTGWLTATRNIDALDLSEGGEFYFSYNVDITSLDIPTQRSTVYGLTFRTGSTELFTSAVYFNTNGYSAHSLVGSYGASFGGFKKEANAPIFVVGKFSYDATTSKATISYWLNSIVEGEAAAYTYSWDVSSLSEFTSIRLQRMDQYYVGTSDVTFDDIRIGSDWVSVIPEPHSQALLLWGGAFCAAALSARGRLHAR